MLLRLALAVSFWLHALFANQGRTQPLRGRNGFFVSRPKKAFNVFGLVWRLAVVLLVQSIAALVPAPAKPSISAPWLYNY